MPARRPLLLIAAVPALLLFACGDDLGEDDNPSPTFTAAASPSPQTPTPGGDASPTPSSTQSGQHAHQIATGPSYFLYVVREGDTVDSIAAYFDGVRGMEGRITGSQLVALNEVSPASLAAGDELAIPLLLAPATAMMPQNTMAEAVTGIPLLVPSPELREGTLDRLALYRVHIVAGDDAEDVGYITEYRLADRAVFRSGAPDPEALYADNGFIVAAGALAAEFEAPDGWIQQRFERDGTEFVVAVDELAMGIGVENLVPMLEQ